MKGKRERRIFLSIAAAMFLASGLFVAQAISVASATESKPTYIQFEAAEDVLAVTQATLDTGLLVAGNEKSRLAIAQENAKSAGGRVIDKTKPMIALTFDDGPNGQVTTRIMTALEKVNGRGTFFLVGSRVSGGGEVVRKMAENGHEIGNHSYSHKNFSKSSVSVIQSEVAGTQNAVAVALGNNDAFAVPALARIPYGANNSNVGKAVGMPMIQWSVDTKDWSTKNASKTASAILSTVKDGDIVLMHDLYSQTADAVEKVAPELAARGFQLVTVEELFQAKGIELKPGVMYFNAR